MKSTGVGDKVFFGPEAEFFIFDDVRFNADPYQHRLQDRLAPSCPTNTGTEYEMGNLGHRPRTKGGYFPVPPVDSCQDIRSEMLSVMAEMGVEVEKHHHEVAAAQHELGIKFGPMVTIADHMQIYKYVIHMVAQAYGKTACFMPKPIFGDNGSGMHVHQSIWKGGDAGVRRQQVRRPVGDLPQLHRRHPQARQGDQRLHQPDHQLLQAPGAGLRGARAARLLGAQPLGVVPHPARDEPEGEARRGPLPRSGRQPVPRLRRDADGRPRRHHQQAQSRASAIDKNLYDLPPAELAKIPTVVRLACARRSTASTRTAPSSRWAA